jgi:hypothetical protein
MQLSSASVESLADGVLTLAFDKAGVAKGFLTGGYDKDLGQVLADMFGVTPTIRTSVGAPLGSGPDPDMGTGPSDSLPRPAASATPPRRADHESGRAAPASQPAGPGRRSDARPQQQASSRAAASRQAPAAATDNEPAPGDLPAPDVLTGTDLIERELGGRVIEELDGP